jgi:TrmH family RNA methyltransferase
MLVELKFPGNIGFIARTMKNFGFRDLLLFNCDIQPEAYQWASHGKDILENAIEVRSFEEAISGYNLVVGTTGITGRTADRHLRMPWYTPDALRELILEKKGRVLLLFGREDHGLSNEILKQCDVVVSVPASKDYPVLNVSHAAAIIFYELSEYKRSDEDRKEKIEMADHNDLTRLIGFMEDVLKRVDYPPHKLQKTLLMFRRILGRAVLTKREIQTLFGVIREIQRKLGGSE